MTDPGEQRQQAVAEAQREIATLTRRVHLNAQQISPDLSYSAYTLLGYIQASGGCRAADLAGHYGLDKSTLSRQLGALVRAGLITRTADDGRQQRLHATAEGTARLARVSGRMNAALAERVSGWSDEDLARFAAFLHRYNGGGPPAGPGGEQNR